MIHLRARHTTLLAAVCGARNTRATPFKARLPTQSHINHAHPPRMLTFGWRGRQCRLARERAFRYFRRNPNMWASLTKKKKHKVRSPIQKHSSSCNSLDASIRVFVCVMVARGHEVSPRQTQVQGPSALVHLPCIRRASMPSRVAPLMAALCQR